MLDGRELQLQPPVKLRGKWAARCDGPCELPKGAYEFRAFDAFGSLPIFAVYNEFSGYKPSLIQGALCV